MDMMLFARILFVLNLVYLCSSSCLWVSYDMVTYADGKALCEGFGGSVFNYNTPADSAPIYAGDVPGVLDRQIGQFWIGLKYNWDNGYHWEASGTPVTFDKWDSDPEISDCYIEKADIGAWFGVSCSDHYHVMCQLPDNRCPCPSAQRDNTCYWYTYTPDSYDMVTGECVAGGGTQVQITDEGTHSFLSSNFNIREIHGETLQQPYHFWTGVKRSGGESREAEDGTGHTFEKYAPGEAMKSGACSYVDTSNSLWYSSDCYAAYHGICQITYSKDITTVQGTTTVQDTTIVQDISTVQITQAVRDMSPDTQTLVNVNTWQDITLNSLVFDGTGSTPVRAHLQTSMVTLGVTHHIIMINSTTSKTIPIPKIVFPSHGGSDLRNDTNRAPFKTTHNNIKIPPTLPLKLFIHESPQPRIAEYPNEQYFDTRITTIVIATSSIVFLAVTCTLIVLMDLTLIVKQVKERWRRLRF